MNLKKYADLEKKLWEIFEEQVPPAEFIVEEDDPESFKDYIKNLYIKRLAGIE